MDETFADCWNRKRSNLGFKDIETEFIDCGGHVLPRDAAPCLVFDMAARPAPIWEVFGIPSDWSPADRERLAACRMIGSDGAGNPICVELGTGVVVLLDHEDWFRTRQFVNTSVQKLAECLLAYIGQQESERFRSAAQAIDPAAFAVGSFWWHDAACLDTDA
ncbi:MAG: SUKH-4 family immunity protein [Pirellulales bacterium]